MRKTIAGDSVKAVVSVAFLVRFVVAVWTALSMLPIALTFTGH
jgi:hypothetical protein